MAKAKSSLSEVVSASLKGGFDLDKFKKSKFLDQSSKFKKQRWLTFSPALRDALSIPGIPLGHVFVARGGSDTGKTTMLIEAAVEAQKQGILPVFIITEMKWDFSHAQKMGFQCEAVPDDATGEVVDYKGFFLYVDRSSLNTIEDVSAFIADILSEQKDGKLPHDLLFLWDSVGSIPIMQNTDGLEMMIPAHYKDKYLEICAEWEKLTKLSLEHDQYNKLILADVNNFIKFNLMNEASKNYLKYWKVIRQYYKAKHKVSQADLDVLLFMYSENYFTRERFDRYNRILTWDRYRFDKMLKDGWFEVFRPKEGKKRTVYKMTGKGRHLVSDIYRKLNGEEIPTSKSNNPMFMRKVRYTHKVYKNMIIEMNEFIQQQRRQSPE